MRTITTNLDSDTVGFTIFSLGFLGFEFRMYILKGDFIAAFRMVDFFGLGSHHNE